LWHDTAGPDRRFYQGLIQAAVAVYHAGNGNSPGARRLFQSGRRYMSAFPNRHLGLDVPAFWAAMERALAEFLPDPAPATAALRADFLPTIPVAPRPAGGPTG
jgi:predicted metal-dependent hydrolase